MSNPKIWEMVQECARELTWKGISPFTRKDLIACVQSRSSRIDPNSINPIIQGLTNNLKGGAPGADGKNILHSVGRGQFVLYSKRKSFNSQKKSPPLEKIALNYLTLISLIQKMHFVILY